MVTYPAAEKFAYSVRLPMMVEPVAKELYGVANPILDEARAKTLIHRAGHINVPAAVALEIMHERVDCLVRLPG